MGLVRPLASASWTDQCRPRPDRESVAQVRQDRGVVAVASFFSVDVCLLRLCRDWGFNVTNHLGRSSSYGGTPIMMLRAKT
jgi:hypothetical protein